MAEWFKAAVLKTAVGASSPWVRIPPPPPTTICALPQLIAGQPFSPAFSLQTLSQPIAIHIGVSQMFWGHFAGTTPGSWGYHVLTDAKCRAAKPTGKAYKLSDSRGLYLFVTATGYRSWRCKYRLRGKERALVLGAYPDMPLSRARDARDAAAPMLRDGQDPSLVKKRGAPTGTPTLKQLAEDWIGVQKATWVPRHARDVLRSLERDVFPVLGEALITEITPPDVLRLLRAIESRPAIETAHRVCQRLEVVFAFGIASGQSSGNPAAEVHAALKPVKRGRQPALRNLQEAQQLLLESEKQPGQPLVKIASRLLALTAVRPGVIRLAQPDELEDLDGTAPI
ncbi:hypothetical protein GCM10009075_22480 [Sphingomonas trueperi]